VSTPSTTADELREGPLSPAYLLITASILVLVTIVAFEAMAVSTAMPTVAIELKAVRSYGLAFSVMLTAQLLGIVLAGVWSDRSGPLPGILAGQVLVAVGSAICGASTHWDIFLCGRLLTGLGGGLLVVMLYVVAGRVYPDAVRPRLFTYISAAWVLPSLLGPPIAGALTHAWSWRLVFWVVVAPIVVTLLVFVRASGRIDDTHRAVVSTRDHRSHVHAAWFGLALAIAAGLVQYGTQDPAWSLSVPTVLAVVGLVGVAVTAPQLVPPGTWRMARGLPSVLLARALFTATFFGAVSYVPLMLVAEHGLSLTKAGLVLAIASLGWAVGSWLQGHASFDGRRHVLVATGGFLLVIGLAGLAVIAWTHPNPWLTAVALVPAGLSMGLGVTTTTVLALELSPVAEHGETSSALQLADVLGSVLGIAAVTAAFAALHVAPGKDSGVYTLIFGVLSVVAALAILAGQRIKA
jgi:MFS family permease